MVKMTRRACLKSLAGLSAAVVGFSHRGAPAAKPTAASVLPHKPNVLFIAVDDLKPLLGCCGDELAVTPNIDRLAKRGTLMLNNHCQQALCIPSRASLLTGLRPDAMVWGQGAKLRQAGFKDVSLPQHFLKNGYHTVATGKIFDRRNVDRGHDSLSWSIPYRTTHALEYDEKYGRPVIGLYQSERMRRLHKEALAGDKGPLGKVYAYITKHGRLPATESVAVPDTAYTDGVVAANAITLLNKLAIKEQPFFLAVGFKRPHLPLVAPKKYWDLYRREAIQLHPFQKRAKNSPQLAYTFSELTEYDDIPRIGPIPDTKQQEVIHGYYACVSYIDAQVGKLLDELDRLAIAQHTIIVVFGDQGFHLGDHAQWGKHTNFEQATRSPLIIAAPGQTGGQKTASPTELVDIFPTLCELASVPRPAHLQGTSLLPILSDPSTVVKPFAMTQCRRPPKATGYALRTKRYRYVAWLDWEAKEYDPAKLVARELYDYRNDPMETVSQIDNPEYRDVLARLSTLLTQYFETMTRV